MNARFADLIGCAAPIQLAGMGPVCGDELCAAVSQAGGLGKRAYRSDVLLRRTICRRRAKDPAGGRHRARSARPVENVIIDVDRAACTRDIEVPSNRMVRVRQQRREQRQAWARGSSGLPLRRRGDDRAPARTLARLRRGTLPLPAVTALGGAAADLGEDGWPRGVRVRVEVVNLQPALLAEVHHLDRDEVCLDSDTSRVQILKSPNSWLSSKSRNGRIVPS